MSVRAQAPFRVERVVVDVERANCWIVVARSGDALVIDPGGDPAAIVDAVSCADATPVALIATHAHADHVGAVAELRRRWGVPAVLHRSDERTLRRANLIRLAFAAGAIEVPQIDRWVEADDEELDVDGVAVRLLHTPGHTPGGLSILVRDDPGPLRLFTGDTLLRGAVGRTDLPGGDRDALARSLRLIAALPRSTRLHPGHGDESELGAELDRNVALTDLLA